MAIAFIRALDGNNGGGTSSVTLSNFNVAGGDAAQRIIIVILSLDTASTQGNSVVRGSQSFTRHVQSGFGGNKRAELWYLVDPAEGAIDIVCTANQNNYMGAGAMLFSGVETEAPFNTQNSGANTNDTPSVAVTTTIDNCMIVDGLASDSADANGGSGQTTRITESFVFNEMRGSTEPAASQATYTQTWGTSAGDWAQVVVALAPFSALEQEGFRFRDDDGNETTASFLANQDTNVQRVRETNTRLRLIVNTPDDPPARSFKLQWRRKGSTNPWFDVIV